MNPFARRSGAAVAGAAQSHTTCSADEDVNHTAGKGLFAEDAGAAVIEGLPIVVGIAFAERGELVFAP